MADLNQNAVYEQLVKLFGNEISNEKIIDIGESCEWQLNLCIDDLLVMVQEIESSRFDLYNYTENVETDEPFETIKSNKHETNSSSDSELVIEAEDICIGAIARHQLHTTGAAPKKNIKNGEHYKGFINPNQSFASAIVANPAEFQYNQANQKQTANANVPSNRQLGVIDDINAGYKILILMRGVPGSGKSHLAKYITSKTTGNAKNHIFSSDDYFVNRQNKYQYNRYKISEAHDFNKQRVRQRLIDGWSPIIVDNTNLEKWEMEDYFKLGVANGYMIHIIEPWTPWARSAGQCAMRNIHNVPQEKIRQMLIKYEPTSVEQMLQACKLVYDQPLPQIRKRPAPPSSNADENNRTEQPLNPVWNNQWNDGKTMDDQSSKVNSNQIMDQRNLQRSKKIPSVPAMDAPASTSSNVPRTSGMVNIDSDLYEALQKMEQVHDDWNTYQMERNQFWQRRNSSTSLNDENDEMTSKPTSSNQSIPRDSQILSILKDNVMHPDKPAADSPVEMILSKHQKDCSNENAAFAQIRQIYPNVGLENLWDLFQKCGGDAEWTIDLLLKDEEHFDSVDNDQQNFKCNCNSPNEIEPNENDEGASNFMQPINVNKNQQQHVRQKCRKPHRNKNNQLKEAIESNCVIPNEFYSNHIQKIRNVRYNDNQSPEVPNLSSSPSDLEERRDFGLDSQGTSRDSSTSRTSSTSDSNEVFEIDLGAQFIRQLDSALGLNVYKDNFKTTVSMPKEFAQQLYSLWMASLYNEISNQYKNSQNDDEEFARDLKTHLNFPTIQKSTVKTEYKDVRDMEFAWAAYKAKYNLVWQLSTRQDLATHMTRQKLIELFPSVDKNTLYEMLEAHGNNFNETVDVLRKSLNIHEDVELESKNLMEKAKYELEQSESIDLSHIQSDHSLEVQKLGQEEAKRSALADFEECRNMAMHHSQQKAECYRQAREVIQGGKSAIALYYTQVANLHKMKIDMYNHRAANSIMEFHMLAQNNPNTLDLHYLHAQESVQCLDVFLDRHINDLRVKNKPFKIVKVVTGQGRNSSNGIAVVKQRTLARLDKRGLKCTEENPGSFFVRINKNSKFSSL